MSLSELQMWAPSETLYACKRKKCFTWHHAALHYWKWSRLWLCDIHAQSFISLNSLAVESAAFIVIMQTPLCNGDPLKRQGSGCVRRNVIQGCVMCQCHSLIRSPWAQRKRTCVTLQSWTDLRPIGLHTCVTTTWRRVWASAKMCFWGIGGERLIFNRWCLRSRDVVWPK